MENTIIHCADAIRVLGCMKFYPKQNFLVTILIAFRLSKLSSWNYNFFKESKRLLHHFHIIKNIYKLWMSYTFKFSQTKQKYGITSFTL